MNSRCILFHWLPTGITLNMPCTGVKRFREHNTIPLFHELPNGLYIKSYLKNAVFEESEASTKLCNLFPRTRTRRRPRVWYL